MPEKETRLWPKICGHCGLFTNQPPTGLLSLLMALCPGKGGEVMEAARSRVMLEKILKVSRQRISQLIGLAEVHRLIQQPWGKATMVYIRTRRGIDFVSRWTCAGWKPGMTLPSQDVTNNRARRIQRGK